MSLSFACVVLPEDDHRLVEFLGASEWPDQRCQSVETPYVVMPREPLGERPLKDRHEQAPS